ncbi:bifunctional sugar phosphate isomerase/epimerase/4-hydroxyphenylpyruvate dioxygenase family protein [Photobacterium sp. BZF1]|uniref:bifunctional sugar phosphate isomerase/epimerase/4-hydroxyphenylpyruvate dioxygenase family protein n=1 Tax=Photobacterium sp. BZF1 TaxID=1904457 RepID=UPI0021027187|nr:sugar phosphate isomerase/epimerase and 4-hydroxyphenylpyruvate domain-containing protein [Photobacterium sp. BZF1]
MMKYSIATVSLSGTLPQKFEAAAKAGFDGVEIFENDLTQCRYSPAQVKRMADDFGLSIVALQPMRDMEGMPEPLRQQKINMLQKKFEVAHELGTSRILMCSNVQSYASADRSQCASDLHTFAELAQREEIKLGYEALAWGRHIADYYDAWDLVKRADHPNMGIILDTFHMFARGNTLDVLKNEITTDKIAMVQVADAPKIHMDILQYSRHFRCFPGQGDLPVIEFLQVLKDKGFDDYLSHEIFNDEFRASSPLEKSVDGIRSLKWLEDQVGTEEKPATPAPDIKDIGFIEFSITDESDNSFYNLLASLGFRKTHVHKSKNVVLMNKGEINIVLNGEKNSSAHEYLKRHGESVCAIGLISEDSQRSLALASRYHCDIIHNQRLNDELSIPAVVGAGDSLVYFLDEKAQRNFYDYDFEPVLSQVSEDDGNLLRIDHIGQTVPNTDMLSMAFFYRSIFGFKPEQSFDLPDINGLITSKTVTSSNNNVKIVLNTTTASDTATQQFLTKSNGASVNQIALECRDIFKAAESLDNEFQLPIPDNYYRDIEAKYGLDEQLIENLQQNNIMYDRSEDGEFFHFYTKEVNGIFFEVLQRVGEYKKYGEDNAFIRLSAQAATRKPE